MIFVTVGTHTQSFNRLLEEMDRLVGSGKVREKVIAQIGHSSYEPRNFEWFRFETFKKLNSCYKNARIIVAHGGAGSILNGLSNKKYVIAVPRQKKYDEHVNDHQMDLVKKLEQKKKIMAVYDIKKLEATILKVREIKKSEAKNKICEEIGKFLSKLQEEDR